MPGSHRLASTLRLRSAFLFVPPWRSYQDLPLPFALVCACASRVLVRRVLFARCPVFRVPSPTEEHHSSKCVCGKAATPRALVSLDKLPFREAETCPWPRRRQ